MTDVDAHCIKERQAIDELWSKELYQYDKTKLNIESKMGNITKCIEAYGTRLLEQIEQMQQRFQHLGNLYNMTVIHKFLIKIRKYSAVVQFDQF
jgi:hypothetical protein